MSLQQKKPAVHKNYSQPRNDLRKRPGASAKLKWTMKQKGCSKSTAERSNRHANKIPTQPLLQDRICPHDTAVPHDHTPINTPNPTPTSRLKLLLNPLDKPAPTE
jgi:hypothetical protein